MKPCLAAEGGLPAAHYGLFTMQGVGGVGASVRDRVDTDSHTG
ncbi:hypothetical protein [Lapillicoccus sp.]